MMRCELITTGNEILDGRVTNTNAQFIGQQLYDHNLDLSFVSMVGDDADDLKTCFKQRAQWADVLIITGGLGPTDDDRTVAVLADTLGLALGLDEAVLSDIKGLFKKRGRAMPQVNQKQALLPAGAEVIDNPYGTAPGFSLVHEDTLYVLLPGVPREMRPLFERVGLERILDFMGQPEKRLSVSCACIGQGESFLVEQIDSLYPLPDGFKIGYRASSPEVRVTLSAPFSLKDLFEDLSRQLIDLLSPWCFSLDPKQDLMDVFLSECRAKSLKVGVAESCTGGLLSSYLTSRAGASEVLDYSVVTYSDYSKTDLLGVDAALIKKEGAVSEAVALAMVQGLFKRSNCDLGVSITGIAGPDGGLDQKPVGLVYFGVGDGTVFKTYKRQFYGDRAKIQRVAAFEGVCLLRQLF